MKIQKIEINKLKMAEYNPRKKLTPKDSEYIKIKNSIIEFGYISPIIVNTDMTVISGHQRLNILKDLGNAEIECIVVDFDKNKEKMLSVALNKISGEWDYQKLENLFNELAADNIDLSIMEFDEKEIMNDNTEIDLQEFNDEKFQCKCPKCGFAFDLNK